MHFENNFIYIKKRIYADIPQQGDVATDICSADCSIIGTGLCCLAGNEEYQHVYC